MHFLNGWFAVELVIPAIAFWIIHRVTENSHTGRSTRVVHIEALRTPTGNSLAIVGLLLPLTVGMAAYVRNEYPGISAPSIVAAFMSFFGVIVVGMWHSFAFLAKDVSAESKITLDVKKDLSDIKAIGVMYSWIVLGMVFLGIFFFRELPRSGKDVLTQNSFSVVLQRPPPVLGSSKPDVRSRYGTPDSLDTPGTRLFYSTLAGSLVLVFDSAGRLTEALETGGSGER